MNRILVIAPDPDFRRSLQFALESEGYSVTPREGLAEDGDFDATVLDHHAVGKDRERAIAFFQAHSPVILLANSSAHTLSPWAFQTVTKPMLGDNLSGAVRLAVEARASPT